MAIDLEENVTTNPQGYRPYQKDVIAKRRAANGRRWAREDHGQFRAAFKLVALKLVDGSEAKVLDVENYRFTKDPISEKPVLRVVTIEGQKREFVLPAEFGEAAEAAETKAQEEAEAKRALEEEAARDAQARGRAGRRAAPPAGNMAAPPPPAAATNGKPDKK